MPIDPSIALGVKPVQLANPLEQFGQFQQVQAATNQNRLADLIFGEKQRDANETSLVNNLYKSAISLDGNLDRNKLLGAAAASGLGSRIPGLQKSFLDLDQTQAKIDETKANVAKANAAAEKDAYETRIKQTTQISQALGALRGMPGVTPQYVASTLQHLGEIGVIPKDHLASSLAQIPQDASQLPTWLTQKQQATMSTLDQMRFTTPDANTVATNATSRANNAATVAASRDNAAATREVAKATRDAASIQRDQATEMKLADDYRAQSKDFKAVADAYSQINSTLDKATTSPTATLAAATKFMKLLDPGSVVRESELGMALAATGAIDRLSNYANTLQHGKVLTANQVADFRNITRQIYGAAQAQQQKIDANYRQQASTYKLRPEVIIQDLGQNAPSPTKPGDASAKPGIPDDIAALLDKHGGK